MRQALLGLLFVNRGLMGGVIVGVCLGHSDHEMVELNGYAFSTMRKKGHQSCYPGFQKKKPLSYSWSYLAEYPGNLLCRGP